jgi:hypothetical protein
LKKASRFAALIAVLATTVWIGGSRSAQATYSCVALDGTYCSTPDSYVACTTDDNFENTCTCMRANKFHPTNYWLCPY